MTDTAAARIAAHPFFAALTDTQLAALAQDGMAATFTAGERLFDEGGIADRFWLIEQGGIALDMRVPGRGDQIVETLGAGTALGWSWLNPPYRWHFGAVARLATTAIAFDASSVRRRCGRRSGFRIRGAALVHAGHHRKAAGDPAPAAGPVCGPVPGQAGRDPAHGRMTGQGTASPAPAEPAATAPAVPCFYRVASRREDTSDTVTLELTEPAPPSHLIPAFAPGQFAMLTAFGVGEVPISVSGLGDSGGGRARRLEHTLRAVGAVTRALHAGAARQPYRRTRPVLGQPAGTWRPQPGGTS